MADGQNNVFTIARFHGVAVESLLSKACRQPLDAALIYSPDACLVARVTGTGFESIAAGDQHPKPVDLARAFEVRAFGPTAELRWTRDGEAGDAVLLADGEVGIPDEDAQRTIGHYIAILDRSYRVWGKPASTPAHIADKWSARSTGRIGMIHVPFPGADDRGVTLKAKEYVVEAKSGNAVVAFERLVGFDHAQPAE